MPAVQSRRLGSWRHVSAWRSSDRSELREAPMADSGQAPLTIGNRYHEERIVETNPEAVVARRTGKASGRGGTAKSTEWYCSFSFCWSTWLNGVNVGVCLC